MKKTVVIEAKRCIHGTYEKWCSYCNGNEQAVKVRKIYNRRKKNRSSDGRYTLPIVKKVQNAGFILLGIGMTLFSGYFNIASRVTTTEFLSPYVSSYEVKAEEIIHKTEPADPILEEIVRVFGEDASEAVEIAFCESRLKTEAINDNRTLGGVGVDRGIFQINDYYHPAANKFYFDYQTNIAMAYKIFRDAGRSWKPWTCAKILGL